MIDSVCRIFRESLEYAAARCCGGSWSFTDESEKEIILKAEKLSGLQDHKNDDKTGLLSIFNIVHPELANQYASVDSKGLFDGFQSEPAGDCSGQYKIWQERSASVRKGMEYAQSFLECFEDCFSTVPSPLSGVSCYHWGKTVASVACCLVYNKIQGYSAEKPFTLYSIDFSGIQSFIYTIISAGALKALKTRSLYLSVLSEYICDMILSRCGLPRCNLIYVGGGRAHILLSSGTEMIASANRIVAEVNQFLKNNFGTSLYLASGWTEAGEEEIHSNNGSEASFSELFRKTSRMISENKLCRYSYDEIRELNSETTDPEGRTCAICGRSAHIVVWGEDRHHLCRTCARLEDFSGSMTDDCDALYVSKGKLDTGLPVPGLDGKVCALSAKPVPEERIIWKYTINCSDPESADSVRIYLSRHRAKPLDDGTSARFDTMANASAGIHRLGVFRGDVDSLGVLFAKGFYRAEDEKPWMKCNLSYYSALSGALTWFFQRNLDRVLLEGVGNPLLKAKPLGEQITVVYAGGDDVFLVGAWNDVLDASLRIQEAFSGYTGGAVTLSGGYSFFPEHTPVPVMADETADLEEEAKQKDGKNAIALFGSDNSAGESSSGQCYKWDEFRNEVLNSKIPVMNELFGKLDDKGNSFLYHILGYFRQVQKDPMAISRLAYLLARHKPSRKSGASDEMILAYDGFMKNIYRWALDEKENQAFRTACLIYVYLNRKANDKNVDRGEEHGIQ